MRRRLKMAKRRPQIRKVEMNPVSDPALTHMLDKYKASNPAEVLAWVNANAMAAPDCDEIVWREV
jgi:hypothetical protein